MGFKIPRIYFTRRTNLSAPALQALKIRANGRNSGVLPWASNYTTRSRTQNTGDCNLPRKSLGPKDPRLLSRSVAHVKCIITCDVRHRAHNARNPHKQDRMEVCHRLMAKLYIMLSARKAQRARQACVRVHYIHDARTLEYGCMSKRSVALCCDVGGARIQMRSSGGTECRRL